MVVTQYGERMKNIYLSGDYLNMNPKWHIEDSKWKAEQILKILKKNKLKPKNICEIGCGGGEILRQLQLNMSKNCNFFGYEISPQAFELCKERANSKLHFELNDNLNYSEKYFDLILIIDVIEHIENYFDFLRKIKLKSKYKVFHIPLELSVQSILRSNPLLNCRELVGHLHYFTKEIALRILKDLDYKIIDYFYTAGTNELPAKTIKSWLARLPRKVLFKINKDFGVRILGGYSLIVLAE